MKKKFLICSVLFILFAANTHAEEANNYPMGLIFNTQSILLDLESYQAGLGLKWILGEQSALRLLFDFYYSNSHDTISATVGTTYEAHFKPYARINPYWGGSANVGVISQREVSDADTWTQEVSMPFSVGALLGVEVFFLEYLSFFAEYSASAQFNIAYSSSSASGTVTSADPDFSSVIDVGMGNGSSLGITIYLDNVVRLDE